MHFKNQTKTVIYTSRKEYKTLTWVNFRDEWNWAITKKTAPTSTITNSTPFACFLQVRTKLDDMFLELKAKMTWIFWRAGQSQNLHGTAVACWSSRQTCSRCSKYPLVWSSELTPAGSPELDTTVSQPENKSRNYMLESFFVTCTSQFTTETGSTDKPQENTTFIMWSH